jgi:hypothetical protein
MEIRARILEFLEIFREETKSLSRAEGKSFRECNDFFEPCQIVFVNVQGQSIQYLLVLHQKTRPDKEITVIDEPTWRVFSALEELLKDERWNAKPPRPERSSCIITPRYMQYRDIVESVLAGIINDVKYDVFREPILPGLGNRSYIYSRDFFMKVNQFMLTDPRQLVREFLEGHAFASMTGEQKPVKQPVERETAEGYGIYLYPTTFIGKLEKKTFMEQVWGRSTWPSEACRCKYKGRDIIIRDDGFIVIFDDDSLYVLRCLNEIMATGLLLGLPFYSARPSEVAEVSADATSLKLGGWSIVPRGLGYRQHHESHYSYVSNFDPVFQMSAEDIQVLIYVASELASDDKVSGRLSLLGESNTCLASSEYTNSFIIGWMILELHLSALWKRYLDKKKVGGRVISKNTEKWNVSYIIESLNLTGLISSEDYRVLIDLRDKRNGVIHRGNSINIDEAEHCFDIASRFLKKDFKGPLKVGAKIKLVDLKALDW